MPHEMATGTHMVELVVPDLCCVECSQGVVTALRQAPGVCDFEVLGMSEKVRIIYDETIQPEKLVQAVEQAGHYVTSWRPEGQIAPTEAPSSRSLPWSRLLENRSVSYIVLRSWCPGIFRLLSSSSEDTPSSEERSWV